METHLRSILKASTWRVVALLVTIMAAWSITKQVKLAFSIGALDTGIKLFVYYLHERAWLKSRFGLIEPTKDYEI